MLLKNEVDLLLQIHLGTFENPSIIIQSFLQENGSSFSFVFINKPSHIVKKLNVTLMV